MPGSAHYDSTPNTQVAMDRSSLKGGSGTLIILRDGSPSRNSLPWTATALMSDNVLTTILAVLCIIGAIFNALYMRQPRVARRYKTIRWTKRLSTTYEFERDPDEVPGEAPSSSVSQGPAGARRSSTPGERRAPTSQVQ